MKRGCNDVEGRRKLLYLSQPGKQFLIKASTEAERCWLSGTLLCMEIISDQSESEKGRQAMPEVKVLKNYKLFKLPAESSCIGEQVCAGIMYLSAREMYDVGHMTQVMVQRVRLCLKNRD